MYQVDSVSPHPTKFKKKKSHILLYRTGFNYTQAVSEGILMLWDSYVQQSGALTVLASKMIQTSYWQMCNFDEFASICTGAYQLQKEHWLSVFGNHEAINVIIGYRLIRI
jgi:hypothetical protein